MNILQLPFDHLHTVVQSHLAPIVQLNNLNPLPKLKASPGFLQACQTETKNPGNCGNLAKFAGSVTPGNQG